MVRACHFRDEVVMGSIGRVKWYELSVGADATADIVPCSYEVVDSSVCQEMVWLETGD